MENTPPLKKIGLLTALSVVVANMIGTGVFTTLSHQVLDLHNPPAIMLLWVLGGITAICGALSYAELGASLPRSGGEYHFLSRIYHPTLGFLSGWVSLVVGFSAPIAAAALALSEYTEKIFPGVIQELVAVVVVIILAFVHGIDVRAGSVFQNVMTILKICLLIFLIIAGLMVGQSENIHVLPNSADLSLFKDGGFATAFAISLVFVNYAYSGWNASAYVAGEISNPKRNLPRSLILGTMLVMVLYLGINYIFLRVVPMAEMAPKDVDHPKLLAQPELAVGWLAGKHIFGPQGGKVIAALITLGLVSTISSMTLAGPRVIRSMGQDFSLFRMLGRSNKAGAPVVAVGLQTLLAVVFVLVSDFREMINYIAVLLSIFSSLTVAGVIVLRIREPKLERPYRTLGFPITPLLFLAVNAWMVFFVLFKGFNIVGHLGPIPISKEFIFSVSTLSLGMVAYFVAKKLEKPVQPGTPTPPQI